MSRPVTPREEAAELLWRNAGIGRGIPPMCPDQALRIVELIQTSGILCKHPQPQETAGDVLNYMEGWLWGAEHERAAEELRKNRDEILADIELGEVLAPRLGH